MQSRVQLWISASWIGLILAAIMMLLGRLFKTIGNTTLVDFFLYGGVVCAVFFAISLVLALAARGAKKLRA